jgi:hypothetical protein
MACWGFRGREDVHETAGRAGLGVGRGEESDAGLRGDPALKREQVTGDDVDTWAADVGALIRKKFVPSALPLMRWLTTGR